MQTAELISESEIQQRIAELAQSILKDYAEEEFVCVGILKGSILFLADLLRQFPGEISIDFMQVSSYHGGTKSSGVVQIRKDLDQSIEGKNVLIVEDIVDTGLTLGHLRELLATRHPKSIKVVSLLSKRIAKKVALEVEYVGFEIDDLFVVGYGLDYEEQFRGLRSIQVLQIQ